jgi:hypothetical protein
MDTRLHAVRAHRARMKKRGMKRLEVYVPTGEVAVIRRAAAVLRERMGEAARLRQVLGFAREPDRAATAVDLFAMPEPPSPAQDALWDDVMGRIERDRKDRKLSRARKLAL